MDKEENKWPRDQLELAFAAIRSGESFGTVSKRTGIPKGTIWDKFTGRSPIYKKKFCRRTVLNSEEEEVIVDWILHLSSRGFPVTKPQLINNVEIFVKNLKRITIFKDNRPGRRWYQGFLRRHPEIANRIAQNITANTSADTEKKLKAWFEEIKVNLDKIGVDELKASRIFNLDTFPFFLCPENEKVYTENLKNYVENDERECLTVVFATNAVGMLAPPMPLFKYEKIPESISQSSPSDWVIGTSSNGWMTADALFEYITNVFHPWLIKNEIQRPIVLYIDSNSSNMTYPLAQFCSKNQIELISLFPNSANILHPLNVGLFKLLKEAWGKCISDFSPQNQIREEDVCHLIKSVVDSLNLPEIMCNGFKKTGLYPFTPDALNFNELFNKFNPINKILTTGLDYPATSTNF